MKKVAPEKTKLSKAILRRRKPLTRSEVMRAVKSIDTKPELVVRLFLKTKKIKFQTYGSLPGHPDMILKQHKTVIRVMGCFWHGHTCKNGNRIPKSNVEYWVAKIQRNITRDKENKKDLKKLGWRILDIWECDLKTQRWEKRLAQRLTKNKK